MGLRIKSKASRVKLDLFPSYPLGMGHSGLPQTEENNMSRLVISGSAFALLLICCAPVGADTEKEARARQIVQDLQGMLDMKDFQKSMKLSEFVLLVQEILNANGKKVAFSPDRDAFRKESASYDDLMVSFGPLPVKATAEKALRMALAQVEPEAAFLIRDGLVEITTASQASVAGVLQQRVLANFSKVPLADALQDLSYQTGASIVLDGRVGDKAKTPVTASFRNDVNLEAALRMLADMADLKMVILQSGLYVTTPANAQKLNKELEKLTPQLPWGLGGLRGAAAE